MTIESLEEQLKRRISERITLVGRGIDRFLVNTPFSFDDGDALTIFLYRDGSEWLLTDEGKTFMHLSYDVDLGDLEEGNRAKIVSETLAMFSVQNRTGRLVVPIVENNYADALYSFIQAILRISDAAFLSRDHVRSTFMHDVQQLVTKAVDGPRLTASWHHPSQDPEGKYIVDYRVNSMSRPLFIFALNSDARVSVATISLLQFEKWEVPHRAVGLFEDQTIISRQVLARFSDVCERQFSSLTGGNQGRITDYLMNEILMEEA